MANLQVGVAGNGTVTVGAGASVHSPASNTLTLGTNGDERLRLDSSGNLSFAGDTNTYIHHPSADQLAITRGGGSWPIIRFGSGGGGNTVAIGNTTSNLVTNSEVLSVRGFSSFKSNNKDYAAIFVGNEGNTAGSPNQLIMWNNGGANRGGIGYVPSTGELRFNNQYYFTFCTGASTLGGTERLRIAADGKVGINTTTPTFAAGGGVQLRGSGSDFTSFRVSASSNTGVDFSQASDGIGYLYNRDNEDVILGTNNTERFRIKAAGNLSSGGEGAPDVSAGGLCLNQGAADTNIFSLKSSDIAHGVTTYDETDTYFSIRKSSGDKGGARIHGFTDTAGGDAALEFQGIIASDADQGYCPIELRGSEANGTGVQNIAADRRIVNIKNSDGTRIASFTGTGLTFGNDSAVVNALDDYEEGSFTGTWTAYTTAASTTATSTNYYTKIGQQVTCYINLANATIAGGGGPIQMTGLPFATSSNSDGGQTATTLLTYKVNFETDRNQTFYTWQSVSFILGYQSRANNTWVAWDVSNFHSGNRYCQFTFTYRTDS